MTDTKQAILGYRSLSKQELEALNRVKSTEELVASLVATLLVVARSAEAERQLTIARTQFEHAFMCLERCIADPETPWNK